MTTVQGSRGRIGFVVAGLFIAVWLVWITVSVAAEPAPGEPTLGELSAHVQQAVVARDADTLGNLMDFPRSDAPDFARRYLDALGPDADGITVTPDATRNLLTIAGHRRTGPAFSYAVR